MPPRRRGNSPPVDPFPPLRRSASASSPSYASIAARSSHPHRDERDQHQPQQQHGWTAEDVDRQDPLDELNSYSGPIDIDPSPPWRSRSRSSLRAEAAASATVSRQEAGVEPQPQIEAGPSRIAVLTTPSGSHAASRTAAISNGARNPPSSRDNDGPSTPSASSSSARPVDRSPPSPSPTRPTRQEGSNPRLAAIFTFEELLREAGHQGEDEPTAPPPRAPRVTGMSIRQTLERMEDRRRARDLMGDVLNTGAYGMERALPTGAGGGEAADRVSDEVERTLSEMGWSIAQRNGDASSPWTGADGVPANRASRGAGGVTQSLSSILNSVSSESINTSNNTQRNVQPLDGSGSSQNVTSFLRRRLRNPAPTSRIQHNAQNPEDDIREPGSRETGSRQAGLLAADSNALIDFGADSDEEDRWGTRLTAHGGTAASGTAEFDIDGWTRVGPGGIGGGTGLSRGGNNRRRESFLQRIGAPPDLILPGEEGEEGGITFPPPVRGVSEATGMEPTNLDLARSVTPVVVRSNGMARAREEVTGGDLISSTPTRKKQKTNNNKVNVESKFASPSRPSYLSYSSLPSTIAIPNEFVAPINKSHLTLSTYSSSSHAPRPLVTFTGCNPKGTDEDATALHTITSIPIACGVHYYEVLVVDKGEEGFMSVGWTLKGTSLRRLVGWDKGSWGWHGDDGRSFEGQGRGERFSETWTTGDTVGCGIDFTTGRAFFTKNGRLLGHRFSNLSRGLYPAVGLRSVGESLAINFNGPFVYDIEGYVKSTRDGIWRQATVEQKVENIPRLVDQVSRVLTDAKSDKEEENGSDSDMKNGPKQSTDPRGALERSTAAFALDFLQHHGHDKAFATLRIGMESRNWITPTLKAKASASAYNESSTASALPSTQRLSDFPSPFSALCHISSSLSESYDHPVPWVLLKDLDPTSQATTGPNSSTQIQLLIHDFVHLLITSSLAHPTSQQNDEDDQMDIEADVELDEKLIEEGRKLLRQSREESWPENDVVVLQETFGLLGDPENVKSDVWRRRRQELAERLVSALRAARGMKAVSHLEQALGQTSKVLRTLREREGKSGAAFVDLKRVLG
ncbi:hypothetical protein CI109_107401 [Kwoniella shandongensis]|uniref:Uncharacterized protein n=1 Tax=Kwoniella shandongensis TaxID=1734106 RepID=A0A5M6BZR9_9TREE|nr:uncharacterized protein CI109_004671 [Kwoniella shandongensis]KAA5526895.1 hypothetical protein CI109_004671 [Kwoniella shandongensis]